MDYTSWYGDNTQLSTEKLHARSWCKADRIARWPQRYIDYPPRCFLYRVLLQQNGRASQEQIDGRTAYIHVVSDVVEVEETILKDGDGALSRNIGLLSLGTNVGTEALLIDLP